MRMGWNTLNTRVTAMAVDQDGRVWAVDTENRVRVAEDTRLLPYEGLSAPIPMPYGEMVTSLAIGRGGQIWAGTSTGTVAWYDTDKGWAFYIPDVSVKEYEVVQRASDVLGVDGLGRAWVKKRSGGLRPGLIDLNQDKGTYSLGDSGLADAPTHLAIDEQGRVWAIEERNLNSEVEVKVLGLDGVWRLYGTVRDHADDHHSIRGFTVDRVGRVWLARYSEEVEVMEVGVLTSDGAFSTYATYAANRYSRAELVVDAQGRLWGEDGAIFMLDADGNLNWYRRDNSDLPDGGIMKLAADKQGRLWILLWSEGLGKLTVFDVEAAFPSKSLQTLLRTSALAIVAIPLAALVVAWLLASRFPGSIQVGIIRDFTIGLLGWFVVLTLFWWLFAVLLRGRLFLPYGMGFGLQLLCISVPLLPSVIAFIFLYRKQKTMALGALAAVVVNATGAVLLTQTPYILAIFGMAPFFLGAFFN
jgi:hypothetical protein